MQNNKKKNLAAALASEPETPARFPEPRRAPRPDPAQGRQDAADSAPSGATRSVPPHRVNKVNIAGWFDRSVKNQLDEVRLLLSKQRGETVTSVDVQAEAYNDLFAKYGLPEIARTKD